MAVIIPFPKCSGSGGTSKRSARLGRGHLIAFRPAEIPGELDDQDLKRASAHLTDMLRLLTHMQRRLNSLDDPDNPKQDAWRALKDDLQTVNERAKELRRMIDLRA